MTLPKEITTIQANAFAGCSNLATVYYEQTSTYKSSNLTIGSSNAITSSTWYCWNDLFTFDTDGSGYKLIDVSVHYPYEVLILPSTWNGKDVISIGDGTNSIFSVAGANSKVKTLILTDKLTKINAKALYQVGIIENLIIPKTVTSIGANAINTTKTNTQIYYQGTMDDWFNVSLGSSINVSKDTFWTLGAGLSTYGSTTTFFEPETSLDDNIYNKINDLSFSSTYHKVTGLVAPAISKIGQYQFDSFTQLTSISLVRLTSNSTIQSSPAGVC
jgi:hypothetical protein